MLGHDDAVLAGVARLLAPGAAATALVSVVARDGVPPVPPPEQLAAAYARHGLQLADHRAATPAEVAASGSSWAKRLRAGTAARPVTLLRFGRQSAATTASSSATTSPDSLTVARWS